MLDDLVTESPVVASSLAVDTETPKRRNYFYTKEQRAAVIELYKEHEDLLLEEFTELAREKIEAPKLGLKTVRKWIADYEAVVKADRRPASK